MTPEDLRYLPPDPDDPAPCPVEVGDPRDPGECAEPTEGEVLCPRHAETLPDDEQVWYAAHAA